MLGEIKRSTLNVNQKKYPKQIQHAVIDLKLEFLVKIVVYFNSSIIDVSQVLSSPLTTKNQTFLQTIKKYHGFLYFCQNYKWLFIKTAEIKKAGQKSLGVTSIPIYIVYTLYICNLGVTSIPIYIVYTLYIFPDFFFSKHF